MTTCAKKFWNPSLVTKSTYIIQMSRDCDGIQ